MRLSTIASVSGVLATVQAAPRPFDQAIHDLQRRQTNTTVNSSVNSASNSTSSGSINSASNSTISNAVNGSSNSTANSAINNNSNNTAAADAAQAAVSIADSCPTGGAIIISTTTVDVTVYVTPTANLTTGPFRETGVVTLKTNNTVPAELATEPQPERTVLQNYPTAPAPVLLNVTDVRTKIPLTTGPSPTTIIQVSQNITFVTSEPCLEDLEKPTSVSEEPCEETTWTSTSVTTRRLQVTPLASDAAAAAPTTTSYVIDTSMKPVTKASMTPTTSGPVPTKTVCEDDNAQGAPNKDSSYCGVKGQPAGVYFIAEFIEERPGVPVSEEGCYQFCDSVMEDTDGCQSYRFYNNEFGAPRCDLYGMTVSHVVKDLDNSQSGKWYDLSCGSPSQQNWLGGVSTGYDNSGSLPSTNGNSNANANPGVNGNGNNNNQTKASAPAAAPALPILGAASAAGKLLNNLKAGPLGLGGLGL